MKTRAFYDIRVAIDLDMVPGRFHTPEDWPDFLKDRLTLSMSYNPDVSIRLNGTAPYVWDGDRYVRPSEPSVAEGQMSRSEALDAVLEMASSYAMNMGVALLGSPDRATQIERAATALQIMMREQYESI